MDALGFEYPDYEDPSTTREKIKRAAKNEVGEPSSGQVKKKVKTSI
jgi:hypothetical protein